MQGNPGEGAIFTDRDGNTFKAILTEETMNGNASLIYTESESDGFAVGSINMAINVPNETTSVNEPYYEHRPNAEWPDQVI